MLVKQKLKMYEKNRKQAVAISSEGKATSASEDYMSRADSLL